MEAFFRQHRGRIEGSTASSAGIREARSPAPRTRRRPGSRRVRRERLATNYPLHPPTPPVVPPPTGREGRRREERRRRRLATSLAPAERRCLSAPRPMNAKRAAEPLPQTGTERERALVSDRNGAASSRPALLAGQSPDQMRPSLRRSCEIASEGGMSSQDNLVSAGRLVQTIPNAMNSSLSTGPFRGECHGSSQSLPKPRNQLE